MTWGRLAAAWRGIWQTEDRVLARWLREQRAASLRNQFEGVCWQWHVLIRRFTEE